MHDKRTSDWTNLLLLPLSGIAQTWASRLPISIPFPMVMRLALYLSPPTLVSLTVRLSHTLSLSSLCLDPALPLCLRLSTPQRRR